MENIINDLRLNGQKITPARQEIISIISRSSGPISALDVLKLLSKKNIKVNKTTVYRELDFLLQQNIIQSVHFNDRTARYELRDLPHHHHLICTSCRRIEEIQVDHSLHEVEKRLEKRTKFKIDRHSLEFFGLCYECEKKS